MNASRARRGLVIAWALLSTTALADDRPHRLSLGLSSVSYGSFFSATGARYALDLGWSFSPNVLPAGLEVGAGLRATTASPGVQVPGEVYGALRFVGAFGPWRPSAGPEVGVSGLVRLPPRRDGFPTDVDQLEDARLSVLYLSFDAAPLRFEWGRFWISALEVSLGAPMFPSGTALRTELGLLKVGYAL